MPIRRNEPSDKYSDNNYYARMLKADLALHPKKYAGTIIPLGATSAYKKRRKVRKEIIES